MLKSSIMFLVTKERKLTWDAVPMCFVAVIKSGKNEMQIVILLRKLNARKIFGSTAAEIGNFILYKHVRF